MRLYIEPKQNPELWLIAQRCGYSGKKLSAEAFYPMSLNSYWDSGYRDYFKFIDLTTRELRTVEQNGTPFDGKNYKLNELPENVALVRIAHGRAETCTIFFRADQISKLLPAPTEELTEHELIALAFIARYKNSYGGKSNIQFAEAAEVHKITQSEWSAAKEKLIAKKYLMKSGAITPTGRNIANSSKVKMTRY